MDVFEVVNITDRLVFQSRHRHLNDLERSIVEGVCEGKTSVQIANDTKDPPYTESHVNEVAARLWKDLSVFLGEKVTKKNFQSMVKRYHSSIVKSHHWTVGNINFCAETQKNNRSGEDLISDRKIASPKYQDNLPVLAPFYGRVKELRLLKEWILKDRCRSIVFYGCYGIGKTALARQLVEDIEGEFETIVWQSLGCKRSLVEFIDRNLLPNLNIDRLSEPLLDLEARISLIIEYLREHRCLIILDDVEDIFSSGELAGNYIDKYVEYGELFRRIRETNHQSCLLRLSDDKPIDIESIEGNDRTIQTLLLGGSAEVGREIFRAKGLVDEDRWEEAIESYGGNPKYLEIVATSIKKSFGGKVSCVCRLERIFMSTQLKVILTRQIDRLSPLEREVMTAFASQSKAVSILELVREIKIDLTDGCDATESLMRRGLIDRIETDEGRLFEVRSIDRQLIIQSLEC
jgi:NB-ARC domain